MEQQFWETTLSTTSEDGISIRGYDLTDLIGAVPFPSVLYLLYTGDLPEPKIARLIDGVMVASIDHGAGAPSALAARTAVSGGASLGAAAAAGLLTMGKFHGAAVQDSMEAMQRLITLSEGQDTPEGLASAADKVVAEWRQAGKRISGYGHRQHKRKDPRLEKLMALAHEAGVNGLYLRAATALEGALLRSSGKTLPTNIDGAMAAILCEIDFPIGLANALFMVSRITGVLAHAHEEQQQMPPMRRIDPVNHGYRGPSGRELPSTMRKQPVTETRILSYQLTDYLEKVGVEVIFGLCGHTNIAFLDALGKSRIRFITTRHEQLAAHMADGYARATGKPGVVLSHLGPGLTNTLTGAANAALDGVPLVVIAGDVPSHYFGRHPHQEMNLHHDASQHELYRPFAKRIWQVERPSEFPRIIERAFYTATSGRPGVVLVDVPMDVFSAGLPDGAFDRFPPQHVSRPTLDDETAADIARALIEATNPVIHVGGGIIRDKATAELINLVEHLDIPVTHTLMGKGALPDSHPLRAGMTGFWGTPLVHDLTLNADLILAIGTRLAEADSSSWDQESTFRIGPTRLMHIDIDGAEIGRNYCTELGAVSDAKSALRKIVAAAKTQKPEGIIRKGLREKLRGGISEFLGQFEQFRTSEQFPLRPERILNDVRAVLPEDGYIVTDVGWNKNGVGQQFDINVPGTFITPGGLATMGFGPAAAMGVKVGCPDKAVLSLIGDGAFSSNMSVVATAAEAGIPVVWLVMDNLAYGTIALLEKHHYGWSFGCLFEDPQGNPFSIDYAMVARACGADGITVNTADELKPALESAFASGRPTLIHCRMENIPTPTPGHWNINDIYRAGE